jgi:hypothetical protein
MVLDVDGEIPLSGLERHAFRDGPARQRPVAFQPKVVVQSARVVALNDEDRLFPAFPPPERLGSLLLISLALVLAEPRHTRSMPSARRS